MSAAKPPAAQEEDEEFDGVPVGGPDSYGSKEETKEEMKEEDGLSNYYSPI